MSAIALEFLGFLAIILVGAYLLPAGLFYYIFFRDGIEGIDEGRIQQRKPTERSVRNEIRNSLIAVVLFAVYSTIAWQAIKAGKSAMYLDWLAYPWWTPIAGFVAAVLLHDTYFYWTHRLIHWPPLFPWLHADHHKSLAPTPWAIFSFQPAETVVQFGFFVILVFLIPMHPVTFVAYLVYDGIFNAAGHSGHEIISKKQRHHWFFKYFTVVTHHDLHHSQFNCNFGQYFTVWDRLFGTFQDRPPDPETNAASQHSQIGVDAGQR